MSLDASLPVLDAGRAWTVWAISQLNADAQRSADTHLIPVPLPGFPSVDLYLKDESVHPSGSLKHRLARSLFLYALVNGWVREGGTVIESSSGSTAVSEAYFARLLRLRFIAVMQTGISPAKVALIERYGGEPHFVASTSACAAEATRLAASIAGAHFMDQFTFAERATDFRSNNCLAASLFEQMRLERHPTPAYVVCGAGTGGTSATLGRYVRYHGVHTAVVVADPERSAFYDFFRHGDAAAAAAAVAKAPCGRIEGIGRPRAEPSFIRSAVDGMVAVPDAFSVGAMGYLERTLGRRVGGSTGTIFCAALTLAEAMRAAGATGSIVGILCDGGERYRDTLYSPDWRREHGLDEACEAAQRVIVELVNPAAAARGEHTASPWASQPPSPARPGRAGEAVAALRATGGAAGSKEEGERLASRLGTPAWPMVLARKDAVAAAGAAGTAMAAAAAAAAAAGPESVCSHAV